MSMKFWFNDLEHDIHWGMGHIYFVSRELYSYIELYLSLQETGHNMPDLTRNFKTSGYCQNF